MQVERVDAYYRLSVKDEDAPRYGGKAESDSISSQRAAVTAYIKEQFGEQAAIVEHIDDGYTGTSFERPGFQRLLQEAYQGHVKILVAKDFSRLGRNWLDVGYYLEKVFPAHRVRVILINEGYDSEVLGETTLELGSVLKNLINEWYSRDISQKIKSVVDIKKMSGEFVYGCAPFGYRKGEKKHTIEVDEPAARTVRLIFSMANQGKTISQIARELNERKVTTPSVYLADIRKNYKKREFWTYESVRNIITNRIYTGDTEAFKSHVVQVGSSRVKSIPWEERPVIEHTHTPIITREEFFHARQVMKSYGKPKARAESDILDGYLVCGCCGNKLGKGRAGNHNYLCRSARYRRQSDCSRVRITKAEAGDILLRSIQSQFRMADRKWKETEKGKGEKSPEKKTEQMIRQLEIWQENSQEQVMALYEEYVEGRLSREQFRKKKAELTKRQELWKKQRAELQKQLSDRSLNTDGTELYKRQADRYGKVEKLDRDILREFVKRVVVMPEGSVRIQWNFADIFETCLGSGL